MKRRKREGDYMSKHQFNTESANHRRSNTQISAHSGGEHTFFPPLAKKVIICEWVWLRVSDSRLKWCRPNLRHFHFNLGQSSLKFNSFFVRWTLWEFNLAEYNWISRPAREHTILDGVCRRSLCKQPASIFITKETRSGGAKTDPLGQRKKNVCHSEIQPLGRMVRRWENEREPFWKVILALGGARLYYCGSLGRIENSRWILWQTPHN